MGLTWHGHAAAEVVGGARVPHVLGRRRVVGAGRRRGRGARVSAAETTVGAQGRQERPQGPGPGLPEEGVLQIQEVAGLGARLVHLGHNTDVVALSAEHGRGDNEQIAGTPPSRNP